MSAPTLPEGIARALAAYVEAVRADESGGDGYMGPPGPPSLPRTRAALEAAILAAIAPPAARVCDGGHAADTLCPVHPIGGGR